MNTSKVVIIKAEDSKDFIKEFNKNKVDKKFLESCKKARELFRKK